MTVLNVKEIYHDLHQIPELGFQEFKTSAYLADALEKLGYQVTRNVGGTGVIGEIKGSEPGPVLMLRADMDALPFIINGEQKCIHACGHDAHCSMVLAAASVLCDKIKRGTLRILFQQGEEVLNGALAVIKSGAIADVDIMLGLHVRPVQDIPYGTLSPAVKHASSTFAKIVVKGKNCHGSRPHLGVNAIEAAAAIITSVAAIKINPNVAWSCKPTIISGGGTLLTDLTSTRSLRYYLLTIRMAHRLGARVLLYGCGIGPITGEQNRRGTAAVLNRSADIVAVRDGASLALLAELGVTKPELIRSRDAAFSLRAEDMRAEASPAVRKKLAAAGKYAVYAVRPWSGDEAFAPELAAAAERLWRERGLTPVFLPMEPPRDLPLSRRIAEAVRAPSVLLDGPMTFEDAFAAVGGAALVVSMRLHALIAASIARVPFVGVSYDVKISSFMKDSGSPACVDYYGATADGLCAAAEYTLREKDRAFAPPAGSENADAVRKLLEG